MTSWLEWLRRHDAGLSATRRAARAAILMPALFAITDKVIGNADVATFGAFGTLSMLLFVDFTGSMRERLAAQTSFILAGCVFVVLGTVASRSVWLACVVTVVVGFVVLFAGAVSSVLASATTALLVSFVLPVTLPGPISSIPDRLAGWALAGVVSLAAIALVWPAPAREPLRLSTAEACRVLGRRLRAEVDAVHHPLDAAHTARLAALTEESTATVAALRTSFFGTPYRPTGLSTAARTLVRLVDEVIWLKAVLDRIEPERAPTPSGLAICDVKLVAAELLEQGGALLLSGTGDPAPLADGLLRLRTAREAMEQVATARLPVQRSATAEPGNSARPAAPAESTADRELADNELISSLEPSFRTQELSVAVAAIAANIGLTLEAQRRSWWDQLLGQPTAGVGSARASARERAAAHVDRHSVWLRNSVRGAVGLALAVFVAERSGVQHSFWVVFGALAILRSSALNTGQNALRGLLGTVVGFVVGGGLIYLIGAHPTVLWLLLPVVVAFAGLAPAAISFTAGQAGFTMTLLILNTIIAPAGWRIGLVRVEDVAIGCAVSVVVGLLFWPRGATSVLGRAVAEALTADARYLRSAVDYGVTRCDPRVPTSTAPREDGRQAAAAMRRLDDAFRGFLSERGTKHLPLADVAALITGVVVLRLTTDAILELWEGDDGVPAGDRAVASRELQAEAGHLAAWYEQTARALGGDGSVPRPSPHDPAADHRLVGAVRHDLNGADGQGTATAVKMIWTADHLDVARRLQGALSGPADAAATQAAALSWLHRGPRASER